MNGPTLNVIQGAWRSSPDWLNLPQSIPGRSPFDSGKLVEFRVCRSDVIKAAEQRRRQPAFEFWSILAGQLPPIPSAERMVEYGDQDFFRLIDAHACFQGIKRPCGADDDGSRTVAFILKPSSFFVFDGRPPVSWMHKKAVPHDLVFVAYARLDEPCDTASHVGVLTHWQFVEADENDPNLPEDFGNRFVKRLW